MVRNYTLSIDESGSANPASYKVSPYFVLSGCILSDFNFSKFKEHLNQVKYATWKEQWNKVLFRSYNIGKGKGFFSVFYNKDSSSGDLIPNQKMISFCRDLRRFLKRRYSDLITCLVDKEKAFRNKTITLKEGKKKMKYIWSQEIVYKLSFKEILRNFLLFLVSRNAKGRIVAEASTDQQDIVLYKEFFTLQRNGLAELKIDHKEVKERMSSLSFVTKHNRKLEEEIADLMAYAATLRFRLGKKIIKKNKLNLYDTMILQGFEKNLLKVLTNRPDKRLKRISKAINPYTIIPE